MLDGIELKGRTNIVALGITTEGVKIPLGLWEGSTENATVATALLSDLVERGLDPEQGDAVRDRRLQGAAQGGPRGVRRGPGAALPVPQRAQRARAPPRARPPAVKAPAAHARGARPTTTARSSSCSVLADELERTHPGAAGSLREGMEETLTVTRLGISGKLRRTLASTNPCESMIEIVRAHPAQRQALVQRRDGAALDRRRDARSRDTSSARSSATPTSPSSPSRSSATSTSPAQPHPEPESATDTVTV